MRKPLLAISTFILLISPLSVMSQQSSWFGAVGGGANIYVGDIDKFATLEQRVAPAIDLSVGKWLHPNWAVRFQYAGGAAYGLINGIEDYSVPGSIATKNNEERFNVMNVHADVMLNFSNWVAGYKPGRNFELVPFMGVGYARSWNYGNSNSSPTFTAGLINKYTLSRTFDIWLEAKGALVNEKFDGVEAGRAGEGLASLTLGVVYKFGKSIPKSKASTEQYQQQQLDIDAVESSDSLELAEMQAELENKNRLIKQLYKDLDAERAKLQDSAYMAMALANEKAAKAERTSLAIFFPIGATLLDGQDIINLGYLADKIKASSNQFTITGYADAGTGSSGRNKYLSDKRAQNVYKILVDKYKVNPEQLEIVAKGGVDNMFESEEFNRVVLIENK